MRFHFSKEQVIRNPLRCSNLSNGCHTDTPKRVGLGRIVVNIYAICRVLSPLVGCGKIRFNEYEALRIGFAAIGCRPEICYFFAFLPLFAINLRVTRAISARRFGFSGLRIELFGDISNKSVVYGSFERPSVDSISSTGFG